MEQDAHPATVFPVRNVAMSSSLSIAIAGAGVAGLAAAAFLADAGHRPVIFERFDAARPVGAGLLIQPTGLAALERLGARAAAEALGQRIERLHGRAEPTGRTVFDLRYDMLAPGLAGLGMHRASLFHVLWQAVKARGVGLEAGVEAAGTEETAQGITLLDSRGRRFGPFDLVLDASGARSKLREGLGPVAIRPYRYGAVWGVGRHTMFERGVLQQRYRSARFMIGVLPIGRLPDDPAPLDAFFWSLPGGGHAAFAAGDLDGWREDVAVLWPQTRTLTAQFADATALAPARYAQLTVRRPWRGRLVLVGDAAHQTSPQLGQGANMALLDGAALADALAAAPVADALPAYAARRRAHVRFYQAASALLTPFFQSDSAAAAWARDLAFGPMAKLPWLRREMIRTLAGLKTGPFTVQTPEILAGRDGAGSLAPVQPNRLLSARTASSRRHRS